MSIKNFSASIERSQYEQDVFQDAIIYTHTFTVGGVATKITNTALTSFGIAVAPAGTTYSATSTRYAFDTLAGNLPWSSYSKFTNVKERTSSPSIPVGSMPKAGSITLAETIAAVPRTEVMHYGSITWLTATTGIFNNVKRATASGGTSYVFTDAAVGTFTNVVPVREKITIWNRTGSNIYIGDSAAIANTPTNAVILGGTTLAVPAGGIWSVWLEPLQDIWVLPAVGGVINIAEYR